MGESESKDALGQTEAESVRDAVVKWVSDPANLGAMNRALDGFQASMAAFARGMQQIIPKILPALEGFGHIALAMQEAKRQEALLSDSGWLPHSALPLDRLAHFTSPHDVDVEFKDFIRLHWHKARGNIEQRLLSLKINESSKDAFREAMNAHEAGLYRCVCRTVMPEIERAVRIDLNAGALRYKGPLGGTSADKILQGSAGEQGFSEVEPGGWFTMILFRKLTEHLYEKIGPDSNELSTFESDPVPNRHATVHGLVDYKTFKNSLNALFMTDYVFQVISSAKEYDVHSAHRS